MDVSRRRLLGGFGATAAGLAGCIDRSPGRTSTALFVTNELESETRVTVRLYELPPGWGGDESGGDSASDDEEDTDENDSLDIDDLEQVLLRRGTLEPDSGFSVEGREVPDAELRIRVVSTDGPDGGYDWERVDERSTIDIRIRENGVQFIELD